MVILGKTASRMLSAYYRGPDHPMKIRFWGWMRKGSHYPRFMVRYAGAGWITLDERCLVQREILVTGAYEPEVWKTLSQFVTAKEIFWDVGAHIGSFSILALLDPRIKEVYAFEPDPDLSKILEYNLKCNNGHWSVRHAALGSHNGKRRLNRAPLANTGLSSFFQNWTGDGVDVATETADELVGRGKVPQPTLIKIDVEGDERNVLLGAQHVLENSMLKAIVFEAESDTRGTPIESRIHQLLKQQGFRVTHIQRENGICESRENFLAVKS